MHSEKCTYGDLKLWSLNRDDVKDSFNCVYYCLVIFC